MKSYSDFLTEDIKRRKRDTSQEKYNVYMYDAKLMTMDWKKISMERQYDGLYRIVIEGEQANQHQSWNDNTWNVILGKDDEIYLSDDFVDKFREKFIREFRVNPVKLIHYPKWLGNVDSYFKTRQFDL